MSDQKGFTGKAKDWKVVYAQPFNTKTEAAKRELQIKGWKNKRQIHTLILEQGSAGSEHPDL